MIILFYKKNIIFMAKTIFLLSKFLKEILVQKKLVKKKNIILSYMIVFTMAITRMKVVILGLQMAVVI